MSVTALTTEPIRSAAVTTHAEPVAAGPDARTRRLLHGPIVVTLLALAWPNVLVMVAQASTGLIETWFISHLGTDALAGMALVFPGVMLMQMISAGAMGGGISSAIARAIGSKRRDDANALVLHALVINVLLGALFSIIMLLFGRPIYQALGGRGGELEAALRYSNVVFAGNVLLWAMNALASAVRGTGNMWVPALVSCVGVVLLVPLSPCLIFGLGPFPALGVAGGGTAVVLFYAGGHGVPRLVHPVRPQYRALATLTAALAAVSIDPGRRRAELDQLGADQRGHRHGDGAGRNRCRSEWRCRFRHRRTAGIFADPDRVWPRRTHWWRSSAPISAPGNASARCALR